MDPLLNDFDDAKSLGELVTLLRAKLNSYGALATQITEDRQIILANAGTDLPDRFAASMPLSHSICQHAVAMDFPLAIDDTVGHPLLKGNMAFKELQIVAYLGAPMHVQKGKAMGAICALERHQRHWTAEDVELITQAAGVADRLIASPQ